MRSFRVLLAVAACLLWQGNVIAQSEDPDACVKSAQESRIAECAVGLGACSGTTGTQCERSVVCTGPGSSACQRSMAGGRYEGFRTYYCDGTNPANSSIRLADVISKMCPGSKSPEVASSKPSPPNLVDVVVLAAGLSLLEQLAKASSEPVRPAPLPDMLDGQSTYRLCFMHPMNRAPVEFSYAWEGDTFVRKAVLFPSRGYEHTIFFSRTGSKMQVRLNPTGRGEDTRVFELQAKQSAGPSNCRGLPSYVWGLGGVGGPQPDRHYYFGR